MDLGNLTAQLGADITDMRRAMQQAEKMVKDYERSVDRELDQTDRRYKKHSRTVKQDLVAGYKGVLGAVTSLQGALAGLGVAIGGTAVVYKALSAYSALDSGLIGVQKTTNLTAEGMSELKSNIQELSKELPTSSKQMLSIAQAAGQLGVQGVDDLTLFTKTMSEMEIASDLAGEEGAKALVRLLNTAGEAASRIDVLSSAIVSLGNQMAASESEIVHMASEIGRATAAYNVSSEAVAAYGAALKSMGARAELSGSAIGRVMIEIDKAIAKGGESFEYLQKITQMTGEEIQQTFKRDASEVFNAFIHGIKRMTEEGDSAVLVLEEFGLKGVETTKGLTPLIQNVGELDKAFEIVNKEVKSATARTEEVKNANKSFENQLKLMRNTLNSTAAAMGEAFAPEFLEMLRNLRDVVSQKAFQDGIKAIGSAIGDMLVAIAEGIGFFGKFVEKMGELNEKVRDLNSATEGSIFLGKGQGYGAGDKLAEKTKELNTLKQTAEDLTKEIKWLESTFERTGNPLSKEGHKRLSETRKELAKVKKEIESINRVLKPSNEHVNRIKHLGKIYETIETETKKIGKNTADTNKEINNQKNNVEDVVNEVEELAQTWAHSFDEMEQTFSKWDAHTRSTKEEADALREYYVDQIKKRNEEGKDDTVRKTQETVNEVQRAYQNALDNMQDNTASTFRAMLDDGLDKWRTWKDGVIDIAKDTIAQIAAIFAQQRIILPVVISVAGSLGFSGVAGAAQQMMGQQSAGGFGFPGTSIIGKGARWVGDKLGLTGAGGILGTQLPGTGAVSYMTPMGPTAASGGLSLGGALGYGGMAGLGYSLLGGPLGLPTSKLSGLTAGVGGALGSWGGSALLGTALGGPIGAILGGLGGGILGGLFGGDEEPWFKWSINKQLKPEMKGNYSFWGNKKSIKAAKAFAEATDKIYEQYNSTVSNILKTLPDEYDSIFRRQLSRGRLTYKVKDDVSDAKEQLEKYVGEIAGKLNDHIVGALKQALSKQSWINIKKGSPEQMMQQFSQAKSMVDQIDKFVRYSKMSDKEIAIEQTKEKYAALAKQLRDLGVDLSATNWSLARQIELEQVRKQYTEESTEAIDQQAEALARIRKQSLNTLESLTTSLMGGNYAPVDSMDYFHNRYKELYAEAANLKGEEQRAAIQELSSFIPKYLDFAKGFGGYDSLYRDVIAGLSALKEDVQQEKDIVVRLEVDGKVFAHVVAEQYRDGNEELIDATSEAL